MTGYTTSTDFPTKNAFQGGHEASGGYDVFVTKLSADGTALVYSTYLGGNGSDTAQGIAVDVAGSAYITGGTNSGRVPLGQPGDFPRLATVRLTPATVW